MNRPRMQRPPSAMSNMRPPTSSRPPSRAASNPEQNPERPAPVKRVQTSTANKSADQTTGPAASSSGSSETNIQVVVRCRDRNKREIEENSGVIISPGRDGHSITVQTSALTELNNKTYSFDRVFGGGSSQQDVFDVTVEPIVQEMLGGYNCTIFAYGQTGTGKTYTMSGDMSDHCGGVPPATAGIIPRSLSRIFQILDAAGDEYSVKCSFIELYNEELRDLLSIQEDSKVKIFDDSTKKGGIIINGMEELAVNDANHGVKILQEGSRKREVAATKCNEVSSRSHSVFTITVHIKQTSTEGEDMLRVGKLNLVDLAGSENVGRSGAENKRAREAGMINQSLLTLGRVINALVDRSQHVPYRESKLTRLLQDSLGGRTKTCIIATLSPAKVNMDETVSTLEYANRAKSIKNKPQVNQMMTKKALIKDYIMEIERLKGDLNSTRMKNGVYMTEESHLDLVNQNESNKLLTEEQQRKIDAMEQQLLASKEQFENTMASYAATKKDLDKTAKQLSETEDRLQTTESSLQATNIALEKETILRTAHQQSEAQLSSIASQLKSTLDTTVHHVEGLHAKVDRKRHIEQVNSASWIQVQKDLARVVNSLDSNVHSFHKSQTSYSEAITDRITSFVVKEMKLFSDGQQYLVDQLADITTKRQSLEDGLGGSRKELDDVLDEIKVLRQEVKSRLGHGLDGLKVAAQRIAEEIADQMVTFRKDTYENYDGLASEIKQVFSRTEKHIGMQSCEIKKLKEDLHEASVKNTTLIDRIAHDLLLAHEVNEQQAREDEAQALLQIQGMLKTIQTSREGRNGKVRATFKQELEHTVSDMREQDRQQSTMLDLWSNSETVYSRKLAKDKEEIKKAILRSWDFAQERTDAMKQSTDAIHKETVELVDAAMQNVNSQTQALEEFVTKAKSMNQTHHATHQIDIDALLASVAETHTSVQHEFTKAKAEIEACGKSVLAGATQLKHEVSSHAKDATKHTTAVRERVATQMQDDIPTQTTPKKQEYAYPSTWQTTRPDDQLLANFGGSPKETNMQQEQHHHQQQQQERNPLGDVDINVTSPGVTLSAVVASIEDELAAPVLQKSAIPAPKSRGSVEKEVVRAMVGSGGQENGARPLKTRKRVMG